MSKTSVWMRYQTGPSLVGSYKPSDVLRGIRAKYGAGNFRWEMPGPRLFGRRMVVEDFFRTDNSKLFLGKSFVLFGYPTPSDVKFFVPTKKV